ncbi:MAG: YggS family pyridoxal phosphate-dependent enzyme [Flavobacteriales bacterium]|nr:YggS family pyridoxal phosphate-dependent enzyme [Flavobacteriales bacterium]OUW94962.1 MAG: YggS family pyridoxal phosphate enzyme [Flavobacteriales bacterium TMED228]
MKMSLNNTLKSIKDEIDKKVKIVVVSKTRSEKEILDIYKEGHKNFGENKVQEILEKYEKLPKDIRWHFIGHLQTNKVKYLIPFISLIHSVDSLKLLKEINKKAKAKNKVIDCLIQVKIANEDSKYGFNINEVSDVLNYALELENVSIKGLMGMATNTNNNNLIDKEFKLLNTEFKKYKSKDFDVLSMGMSNDYKLAISNESNMIRLGSIIFGIRK